MQAVVFGVLYLLLGVAWLGIGVLTWVKRRDVVPESPALRKLSHGALYFALALMLEMVCSALSYLSLIGWIDLGAAAESIRIHLKLWPKGLLLPASAWLFWRIMRGDLETLVLAADIKPQLLQTNMALAEAREALESQYRQLAHHNTRQRELNEALEQVGSPVNVAQVARTAAEQLVRHFSADTALVWDVRLTESCDDCAYRGRCSEKDRGCLHLAGTAGRWDNGHDRPVCLPLDPCVAGPLVEADPAGRPLPEQEAPEPLRRPGAGHPPDDVMVAFPLRWGGDQVGAMALWCRRQPAEQDLSLLQSLARFTAAAIESARRYEQMEDLVRQRTRTLEARNRQLRLQSAELQLAYRHKSEFLAIMSHELHTPLTSIIGFADLITNHMADALTERQRDALGRIERNGQDLLYLINQILDYSKIDAGKMSLSLQPVVVTDLLKDVLARFGPQADHKGLALTLHADGPPVTIETDSHRLRQVLGNLLSNAVKFTSNGSVTLGCETREGYLHLSVADTGPGIAAPQLPRVFEEFRQADSSSTRQAGGTGLGLAICRRLVRLLGGELRVWSRPGKGSRFTVLLPLPDAVADGEPRPAPAVTVAGPEGGVVLIVDEDEQVAGRLAAHVTELGLEAVTVRSAGEAVDAAQSRLPVAVLTDLILPQTTGWALVERLHSHPSLRHVPVVLTGIVDDPTMAVVCGAAAYLLKPVDLDRLRACLAELLPERAQVAGSKGAAPAGFADKAGAGVDQDPRPTGGRDDDNTQAL